jgi:hypothetical protein
MPTLTVRIADGTVVDVELTDAQVEMLFECLKRNLQADLNVWEPVFVFWLSAFAQWWIKQSTAMQKYWEAIVAASGIGGTVLAHALTKWLIRIVQKGVTEAEARLGRFGTLAVGLFLAGIAIGTVADAVAECWRLNFPDKAELVFGHK